MATTIQIPLAPSITPVWQSYSLDTNGNIGSAVGSPITGSATASSAVYSFSLGTMSTGDYHGEITLSGTPSYLVYFHVYADGTYVKAADWSELVMLVGGVSINVLPLTGVISTRTDDQTITTKYDEATTVTMTLTSGDLTGKVLAFVVTDKYHAVALNIADADIARTATSWTLKIPRTFNQKLTSYTWALRDASSSDNVELQGGVLSCEYAPSNP